MLEDAKVTINLEDLDKLRKDKEELWLLKREIGKLMNVEMRCGRCSSDECEKCKTKIKVEVEKSEIKEFLFNYIYYSSSEERDWIAHECAVEEAEFYYI
ncbi:hypothetical protein L9Z07_18215 [Clostridioides difficile]|nr:hypothetical protein [Clostridioides difficile]MBY2516646.1 hypothetical protein [Clostridioides difficile]MCG3600269.1 hypothetical protein [Clostridioides difficile]HBG0376265.1 hypothetical protein [Clostridioides difficile]HBG4933195.1 hypothetical protein [Clostridioides difficile]HBG8385094.1 hypothetical protein [Clostridioides difficile]